MSNNKFNDFLGKEHSAAIKSLEKMWNDLKNLADFAKSYGIDDIFQDNGAKVLQQIIYLNMRILPGREGNDAVSASGIEWEMKSINLDTSASGFSTNHHTNHEILSKFRSVPWTFSIYHGIELDEIYVLTAEQLEPIFQHWEEKLKTQEHINNPKIPVQFVREKGTKVYPIDSRNPIDPDSLVDRANSIEPNSLFK